MPVATPYVDLTSGTPPKDLEGACRQFEEAFATLVFRKMHEVMVPKTSKGSAGFARETTQGLLDAQWARLASQGEGLGLWRTLYRQLSAPQVKSGAEKVDENPLEEAVPGTLQGARGGLATSQPRSPAARQASGLAAVPGALGHRSR